MPAAWVEPLVAVPQSAALPQALLLRVVARPLRRLRLLAGPCRSCCRRRRVALRRLHCLLRRCQLLPGCPARRCRRRRCCCCHGHLADRRAPPLLLPARLHAAVYFGDGGQLLLRRGGGVAGAGEPRARVRRRGGRGRGGLRASKAGAGQLAADGRGGGCHLQRQAVRGGRRWRSRGQVLLERRGNQAGPGGALGRAWRLACLEVQGPLNNVHRGRAPTHDSSCPHQPANWEQVHGPPPSELRGRPLLEAAHLLEPQALQRAPQQYVGSRHAVLQAQRLVP